MSKKKVLEYLVIIIGSIILALGLSLFLIPNRIAPGGITGLATILYHLLSFPPGLVILLANLPLLLISIYIMGMMLGLRTLVGVLVTSLAVDYFNLFLPVITKDPLLAAIYGGLLMGLGLGLVFRARGSTGGTDLIAQILHHFLGLSFGQGFILADFFIVLLAGFVFNAELALYAFVSIIISSKVVDLVQEGFDMSKGVLIISPKTLEIREAILGELERGVTIIKGQGGYTGEERDLLLCVIPRALVTRLKHLILKVDPHAFVIFSDVKEVLGEGFKDWQD